ncbi:glycosyltransferase family 4 protein [Maridesulfovibrio sp.]|uniref:glycosyltransferase family 4 protein n=1 Tax=Maridesulfovibrio sp. TaxID=2795000 RepID=UPI002A187829|nr:glycosyltransferase family 4 protein [Maridesulfovibrio sp.]
MEKKVVKVLVSAPDPELMGGVSETVKLLVRELEGSADVLYAPFGRRKGQAGVAGYAMPFLDLFRFAFMLCRERFDVIHMNPSLNPRSVLKEFFLFVVFCLFGYSGRILLLIHGWEQDFFERIASRPFALFVLRKVMKRAGAVLVLAGEFRDSLIGAGVDGGSIGVVTTMVDMSNIPTEPRPQRDCLTILSLSRLVRNKGVYEIIDAFGYLNRKYDNLELIMAGEGPERSGLEKAVSDKDLSNVHFPGYVRGRDKYQILEKSCIFLLPSRREGCPVSLLEAMAAGLAPVVTDVGGIKDVIQPGRTAVLLREVSSAEISGAVESLLADNDFRLRICADAARYAAEHFGSGMVTQAILRWYEDICSSR